MLRHQKAGIGVKPIFLMGDDATRSVRELPDETEVLYVRKKLDGEILPAKAAAKHADNG